jgi:quinol monooxygenase YgiN
MAAAELAFYVRIHVRPECVSQWRREVDVVIEHMSREDAFVSCYLHQDAQDPNLFTLYERWNEPSVEAFLRNQDKPYRQAYEAKLPALLQRPREAAVLVPLAEWHKTPD